MDWESEGAAANSGNHTCQPEPPSLIGAESGAESEPGRRVRVWSTFPACLPPRFTFKFLGEIL